MIQGVSETPAVGTAAAPAIEDALPEAQSGGLLGGEHGPIDVMVAHA